jgi:hypothetical protein
MVLAVELTSLLVAAKSVVPLPHTTGNATLYLAVAIHRSDRMSVLPVLERIFGMASPYDHKSGPTLKIAYVSSNRGRT